MKPRIAIGGFVLVLAGIAAFALQRRSASDAEARRRWKEAIRTAFDPARDSGWVETFETTRSMPLGEYDPRWRPLFGRLLVDRGLAAAIGDPEGGWERDGGDDYAFRESDAPTGSIEMTVDGWWDGQGSIGAQVAVQRTPPHRLYEAALWRGRLALIHFIGPTPDRFEVIGQSADTAALGAGFYRLVICAERTDSAWHLNAVLRDPAANYRILRRTSAVDARLPQGVQGIGLLGGGGRRGSYVTGIVVRSLQEMAGCGARTTP
jgi:hypothetical protein